MTRDDISDKLVHFIRGRNREEAAMTLRKILSDGYLMGSDGYIKGKHKCVCFSEAPVSKYGQALMFPFSHGYSPSSERIPYQPFGIVVSKVWLFELGGRPVIYGSDEEYVTLPTHLQWRHVRYEPNCVPPIDFSWEREWRVKTDRLTISPSWASIVVPDKQSENTLHRDHDCLQMHEAEMWSQVLGQAAYQMVGPFPYQISPVQDAS